MKWKDATKDDSFGENFHKAIIESNKEISFVASKLGITVGSCLWYYYNRYKPSNNYKILKCHIRKLQMEQTRNHDECAICDDGGGEFNLNNMDNSFVLNHLLTTPCFSRAAVL